VQEGLRLKVSVDVYNRLRFLLAFCDRDSQFPGWRLNVHWGPTAYQLSRERRETPFPKMTNPTRAARRLQRPVSQPSVTGPRTRSRRLPQGRIEGSPQEGFAQQLWRCDSTCMSRDRLPEPVAANEDIGPPFLPAPILTIADAFDRASTGHNRGVADDVHFVVILRK
jgi:hypothetical protein